MMKRTYKVFFDDPAERLYSEDSAPELSEMGSIKVDAYTKDDARRIAEEKFPQKTIYKIKANL